MHEIKQLVNISKERQDIQTRKQKKIKLKMQPPSIPTSFQTFRYSEAEVKAFNTTETRFKDSVNDLPGPGYYKKQVKTLPVEEESISKFGYGNGFASKGKRFGRNSANVIGPGDYEIKTEVDYHTLSSKNQTAAFTSIDKTNRTSFIKNSITPSPTKYTIESDSNIQGKGATHVFKSRGNRIKQVNNHVPSPSTYTIPEKKLAIGYAAFRATGHIFEIKNNDIPAPTRYNTTPPQKQVSKKPKFIPIPQQITQIPEYMTPQEIVQLSRKQPGPGSYNVIESFSKLKVEKDFASVFKGQGRNEGNQGDLRIGPGYYMPVSIQNRSFRLNLDKIWV